MSVCWYRIKFYDQIERDYSALVLDEVLFGETVGEDEMIGSGTAFQGLNFTRCAAIYA